MRDARLPATAVFVLACLCTLPARLCAVVIRVPADQPTIQAGIDAASFGDTVLVAPGTYLEHLYMGPASAGVVLLSEAGPDSTIIDNQWTSPYPVIHCDGVGGGTVIRGFTLTRGNSYYHGGGVRADNADVSVVSCVISGCRALRQWGGGIGTYCGSVQVNGCRIEGNRAGDGGGVGILGGAAALAENAIIGNAADSFGGNQTGGGVYASCDYAEITNNTIEGNYSLHGGGVQSWGTPTLLVSGNAVLANAAGYEGGGLATWGSAGLASGNVIAGNHAAMWGGGAVSVRGDRGAPRPLTLDFVDNVFFRNTSGGHECAVWLHFASSSLTFRGNFLTDGTRHEVLVYETPSTETLDFVGNWWGTADPDSIASLIYDCADDPDLLWCVDFSSWCTDPSCAGQVTGVPDTPEPVPFSWSRIKGMYR